jgi:hypothetical protein
MEVWVLIVGGALLLAAFAIPIQMLTYRLQRDGNWHESGFTPWMVTTVDGKRAFGLFLQRRMGPNGDWQYREKTTDEREDSMLDQNW